MVDMTLLRTLHLLTSWRELFLSLSNGYSSFFLNFSNYSLAVICNYHCQLPDNSRFCFSTNALRGKARGCLKELLLASIFCKILFVVLLTSNFYRVSRGYRQPLLAQCTSSVYVAYSMLKHISLFGVQLYYIYNFFLYCVPFLSSGRLTLLFNSTI